MQDHVRLLSWQSLLWVVLIYSIPAFALQSPNPRILVVGGNGRVGGSTAKHIHLLSQVGGRPTVDLVLGGRSKENFAASRSRIFQQLGGGATTRNHDDLPAVTFQPIDLDSGVSKLEACLQDMQGVDLVVHTAGPFQQRTSPDLLKACVNRGISYVDVCDEVELCKAAKKLQAEAVKSGCVAVVAGGIWPGVSALMAAEAVEELRRLNARDHDHEDGDEDAHDDDGDDDDELDYAEGEEEDEEEEEESVSMSFFTAGTGNAGATIVSATFLLLCSPVITFVKGKLVEQQPWSSPKEVDFGSGVGPRTVWLLDNPDVFTVHASLKVPNLASRFATAPGIWNRLFGVMKAAVPASFLGNKPLMQGLSVFSLPVIRLVDRLVGATNSMRVDAVGGRRKRSRSRKSKGARKRRQLTRKATTTMTTTTTSDGDGGVSTGSGGGSSNRGTTEHHRKPSNRVRFQVTHSDLEQCVGLATAAFALEVLSGSRSSSSAGSNGSNCSPSTDNGRTRADLMSVRKSKEEAEAATEEERIPPGIYFPAELPPFARRAILNHVKRDATLWKFESTPGEA